MGQTLSKLINLVKKSLVAGIACTICICCQSQAKADFIDLDLTGIAPQYRPAFIQAETFWENRIVGFSNRLPGFVRRQLNNIQITAITGEIDGLGGVLAFAGPNDVFTFNGGRTFGLPEIAVAQSGTMTFDFDPADPDNPATSDIANLLATGLLDEVVQHEMAHVFGIGTLWGPNGLNAAPGGNYIGQYGLDAYRADSGNTFAPWVPVDPASGGHWDAADPYFFNPATFSGEIMIPFITSAPVLTQASLASFADLWFNVNGVTTEIAGPSSGPKTGGPGGFNSIPEPSSYVFLGLVAAGLVAYRRRKNK